MTNQENNEPIIYQPDAYSPTIKTMISRGTLDNWKQEVVKPITGNPYLVAFLAAAFVGPLLKPARQDSFGMHLFGLSSRGKTTALQVAASVWGNGSDPAGAPESSFIRKWNTTENAVEAICKGHNDVLMCLDEIKTFTGKDVGRVIYNIFGGQGKSAMSQHRDLKDQRVWRIVLLSSGELSAVRLIEENGATVYAGQQVRFLDIPIIGNIIPDAKTADAIKAACSQYYGVAGTKFVQRLINEIGNFNELQKILADLLAAAIPGMPDTDSPEKARAMKRFALIIKVAGLSAVRLLDLPIDGDEIRSSIDSIAKIWLGAAQTMPDMERGVLAVRDFILKHRESRFKCLNEDVRLQVLNLAGYWDKKQGRYYFTPDGFREACGAREPHEIAKELNRRKLLYTNELPRLQVKYPSKMFLASEIGESDIRETLRGYAVKEAIHGDETDCGA